MIDYKIQKANTSPEELSEVCSLFKLVFPNAEKYSPEYLEWQYTRNPRGGVVGYNAYWQGELAAHYAAIPICMCINGVVRRGLLSLNTATHPRHRGNQLFTILANKTYAYAAENGYDFVIGVANANSTHGFLKHLGFYQIAQLDTKVGVYSKPMYCEKSCFVSYDEEVVRWRLANPFFRYNLKAGTVTAPMMIGVKAVVGFVADKRLRMNSFGGLLYPLNLYVGLGAKVSNLFYARLPRFVKRSPLNLIFKDLTGDLPIIGKSDIFFQVFDFDVL